MRLLHGTMRVASSTAITGQVSLLAELERERYMLIVSRFPSHDFCKRCPGQSNPVSLDHDFPLLRRFQDGRLQVSLKRLVSVWPP